MTKEAKTRLREKLQDMVTNDHPFYQDWLNGDDHYETFDKMVRRFLGKKLYYIAEIRARLDSVLVLKLGVTFFVRGKKARAYAAAEHKVAAAIIQLAEGGKK